MSVGGLLDLGKVRQNSIRIMPRYEKSSIIGRKEASTKVEEEERKEVMTKVGEEGRKESTTEEVVEETK